MNILLLGSGGREHAIAWKIAKSPKLTKLYIATGNAGTSELGTNVDLDISNFEQIKNFVIANKTDMIVVGPEAPLVAGIYDFIKNNPETKHIPVIGPSKAGAVLEGSKDFAKAFMKKYNIPTAEYKTFSAEQYNEATKFIDTISKPYVLKADGLAAGKGVLITNSADTAKKTLKEMFDGKFGEASKKVVVEQFLDGIELSVFVLTDGENYLILPEAKDYKRIGEGDTGLNTGGMGAISPVPFVTTDFMNKVEEKIIKPTINGLRNENIDYKGFIFFGLMNVNNEPYVIEYNVRMGDPETEVVMPRIKTDIIDLFVAAVNNSIDKIKIDINPEYAATVMLVSGGYPQAYEKGKVIENLDKVKNSIIFHAGTKKSDDKILTNGGRVIAITSFGNTMKEALNKSYENAEIINFEKKYYRKDIGFDLEEYA